jgi:antitoxin (DNA-binding transcriptional repressor) of toxin-antitoxin stability system
MRSVSISVTEAARNFADCINRVRYQGTSFILHKNGVAVARIVPESRAADEREAADETATKAAEPEPSRRASIPEIW